MAGLSRTPFIAKGLKEREFLRVCGERGGWENLHGHVVMYLGCGDGLSAINIVNLFPGVKRIVGIDCDKKKIEEAKMVHPHRCIEYRYADIQIGSTISRWENQMTKVISIYSLQRSRDQTTAFRHIYLMLMHNGEAVILFSLQSGYYDWYMEILSHPRWKAYTEGFSAHIPESHKYKLGSDHYKELLKEVGFAIILCLENRSTRTYSSDDELKAALFAFCPLTSNIPEDLMDEFQEDSFQAFLKHNTRDTLGRPCVSNINFLAVLHKKHPF